MKRVLAVLLIASLALSQNPIRSGGGAGGGGSSYFAGTGLILSSFTFSVNTAIIASIDDYQDGRFDSAVCTGTNAYTCNPAQAFTGALVTGSPFRAQFTNASTGAVTLNVSALGAKKAYRIDRTTQLGSGDLAANSWHSFVYDTAADSGSGGWIQQSGGSGGGGVGVVPSSSNTFANLPTCNSGINGQIFWPTDGSAQARCNGTSWEWFADGVPITLPPTTGWTVITLAGGGDVPTFTATGPFMELSGLYSQASALEGAVRPVPGSTPYKITAWLADVYNGGTAVNIGCGLQVTNGTATSSKAKAIDLDTANGRITVYNCSDSATCSAVGGQPDNKANNDGRFMVQYEDDGTTRYWRYRHGDGKWITKQSEARTTDFTATHIGVYCLQAGYHPYGVILKSWKVE